MPLIPVRDSLGALVVDQFGDQVYVWRSAGLIKPDEWLFAHGQGASETWGWRTDVQKVYDGTESRYSVRPNPRRQLGYTFTLDESERRYMQAAFYNDTDQPWRVPVWSEGHRTTSVAAVGTSVVTADFVRHNLKNNDLVYIHPKDGGYGEFAVVSTVIGDTLTITGTWSQPYAEGSHVFPARLAGVPDRGGLQIDFGLHGTQMAFEVEEIAPLAPNATSQVGEFNGTTQGATHADNANHEFSTAFTQMAWVRSDRTPTGFDYLWGKGRGGGDLEYYLHNRNTGLLFIVSDDGTTEKGWGFTPAYNPPVGVWTHLCFVWDQSLGPNVADQAKAYINGVEATISPFGTMGAMFNGGSTFNVALRSTEIHDGGLAHLRGWAAALTPAEILREMRNPAAYRRTDLRWEYALDGDLTDASGNGLDLTEVVTSSYSLGAPYVGLNTYQSKWILEQHPRRPAQDVSDRGLEVLDYGSKFVVTTGRPRADLIRRRQHTLANQDALYYWQVFLDQTGGGRESFYMPTYQEDLVLDAQPGASATSIVVGDDPNFDDRWFTTGASHKDVTLVLTDGALLHRRVTTVTNNMDGTLTLDLDSALPASFASVDRVSFLELVRLEGDAVRLIVEDAGSYAIECATRVIEQ